MLQRRAVTEEVPWRFEYKYQLSRLQYYRLKNNIVPFCEPDLYTRKAVGNRYLVRSLYFDNDQFQAYYEKIEGTFGRIKCRIRTYSDELQKDTTLRAELKNRWGEAIEKYSTFIKRRDYESFMKKRHWPGNNPILQEFERIYYLRAMKAKVLVEYFREGYNPRDRSDVRITFDHDVRSCYTDTLFPLANLYKYHHYHMVILEIKCRTKQPAWLSKIVRNHGLKYIANSKYTQGLEAVRPDLLSPY